MNGDELLRGYRPAGPPPDLRARIRSAKPVSASLRRDERSTLSDWLPALVAAALFLALSITASIIRERIYEGIAARDAASTLETPAQ